MATASTGSILPTARRECVRTPGPTDRRPAGSNVGHTFAPNTTLVFDSCWLPAIFAGPGIPQEIHALLRGTTPGLPWLFKKRVFYDLWVTRAAIQPRGPRCALHGILLFAVNPPSAVTAWGTSTDASEGETLLFHNFYERHDCYSLP